MGRIFKARYWVKLPNGNTKQGNEIEFTFPEDIHTASLYIEEKKGGRVSNIISTLTGHSASSIEVKELFDLGNKSSSERNSDAQAERDRKTEIFMEKLQDKRDIREAKFNDKWAQLEIQIEADNAARKEKARENFDDLKNQIKAQVEAKIDAEKEQRKAEKAAREEQRKAEQAAREKLRENGKDKAVYDNGDVYEGDFFKGKRHGKGKYVYANHTIRKIYDGEWDEGNILGLGRMDYKDGSVYIGYMDCGEPMFEGKLISADGTIKEGKWNGLEHCIEKTKKVFENGDVYEGEIFEGEPHGKGRLTTFNGLDFDGSYYEGTWKYGELWGEGVHKEVGVFYYEGEFVAGKKQGKGKMSFDNGSFYEGEWDYDCQHGLGFYFDAETGEEEYARYENGELKEKLLKPLKEEEIRQIIQKAIIETDAKLKSDIGKVIALARKQLSERADSKQISSIAAELIESSQRESILKEEINLPETQQQIYQETTLQTDIEDADKKARDYEEKKASEEKRKAEEDAKYIAYERIEQEAKRAAEEKLAEEKRKAEEDAKHIAYERTEQEAKRAAEEKVAKEKRKHEEASLATEPKKRNWKIILPITIIVAAIIAGMLYWNNGAKQEAEKLSQQLEQIEDKVKLAIQSGDREKSLNLVNQLVHPSHKDMESQEFDAFNGYPKYDEYWSKKRDEYKSEIMKLTGSTSTQAKQAPTQDVQSEQTIDTTIQQIETPDFSNLIGEWKGKFGDNQLALTIEAINDDGSVTGFNIVKNNKRALTGVKNGAEFELKEPGDDKWDGVFKFTIAENIATGTWTANNGKSTKQFTLTK